MRANRAARKFHPSRGAHGTSRVRYEYARMNPDSRKKNETPAAPCPSYGTLVPPWTFSRWYSSTAAAARNRRDVSG